MKVLLAEDHAETRAVLAEALRRAGHAVTAVADGDQAWDALAQEEFDLAVLDWVLPGRQGPDLCRALRAQARAQYLYVLLLTGHTEIGGVVPGLDAGADDYLAKPCRIEELLARVRAGTRVMTLQRQLREANERDRRLALSDELTGLPNRRATIARLEEEVARGHREERALSVVLTDVDNFKQINDTLGHAAGDAALRELAARMRQGIRSHDGVGRFGGDEFLVVLPGLVEEQALALAQRLCARLASPAFVLGEHAQQVVTSSFGVAQLGPGVEAPALLAQADRALYFAKSRGGNCAHAHGHHFPEGRPPRSACRRRDQPCGTRAAAPAQQVRSPGATDPPGHPGGGGEAQEAMCMSSARQ